jgi:hypothetical protein
VVAPATTITPCPRRYLPVAKVPKEARVVKGARVAKVAKDPLDPHRSHAGTAHVQWSLHLTISSVLNASPSTLPSKSAQGATRPTPNAARATIAAAHLTAAAYSTHPSIETSPTPSSRPQSQETSAPTWTQAGAPPLKLNTNLLRAPSCPTPTPTRSRLRTTHAPLDDSRQLKTGTTSTHTRHTRSSPSWVPSLSRHHPLRPLTALSTSQPPLPSRSPRSPSRARIQTSSQSPLSVHSASVQS